MIGQSIDWLIGWLIDRSIYRLIDRSIYRLIDWSIDWSIDRLQFVLFTFLKIHPSRLIRKGEADPLFSSPAPWQRNKSKMADDKVLWFEKVGCKCQDFICVRRSMIVMNFCGEPKTERNRGWRAVCASGTSQSLQSLSDFICTVLSFPIASLPPCILLSCLQSITFIFAFSSLANNHLPCQITLKPTF